MTKLNNEEKFEKPQIKRYPKPDYAKCNAGHNLINMYDEKKQCYEWDCLICIEKMKKAEAG